MYCWVEQNLEVYDCILYRVRIDLVEVYTNVRTVLAHFAVCDYDAIAKLYVT